MPTVLVRTPYGRRGPMATVSARLLAERGLQVLLQSCRGTFGSGGDLEPFREREDGLATIAWIKAQPWHQGPIGAAGASYLGIAQWAMAADAGPDLAAMVGTVTASNPHAHIYQGGAFSLELALGWAYIADVQERPLGELRRALVRARLRRALDSWPLSTADASIGRKLGHYRDWLEYSDVNHPYWEGRNFAADVSNVHSSVELVTGWHDLFLPGQLEDYRRLRDADRDVYLTVGPWTHVAPGLIAEQTRRSIELLQHRLAGHDKRADRPRVMVHVAGADEWRAFPDWPPPNATPQRWHLHGGGLLAAAPPNPSEPDTYVYDPGDPTPAVGGPVLFGRPRRNNRKLEARADVVIYTTVPIKEPLDIAGPVLAEIYVASDRQHIDLFARLCDVSPRGVSRNVCDGLLRLSLRDHPVQPDGTRRASIELWPTAYRFLAGHRVRLQISSGAHPRFARNPGTGTDLHEPSPLLAATQRVYHDPMRPSAVVLPVLRTAPPRGEP